MKRVKLISTLWVGVYGEDLGFLGLLGFSD